MAVSLVSTGVQFPDNSIQTTRATQVPAFTNRIINGNMVIDQRNAGAEVNPAVTGYYLDRWNYFQNQTSKGKIGQNAGAVTPPVGFTNYLGFTSTSAYALLTADQFFIRQDIEGLNTADLAWGTASAATVTLSFWVRSSLTGSFGGAIQNSGRDRNYPFAFTINSANTWEYKTVTISGDTTGTWLTTNGRGITVTFSLGTGATYSATAGAWTGTSFITSATGATSVVGTNGATFYITGVQLEKGSTATSFDYRPYGTELALCQRYYYRNAPAAAAKYLVTTAWANQTTTAFAIVQFPVIMRTAPSALEQTGTAGDYAVFLANSATTCSSVPAFSAASEYNSLINLTVASGLTVGQAGTVRSTGTAGYLGFSAEL